MAKKEKALEFDSCYRLNGSSYRRALVLPNNNRVNHRSSKTQLCKTQKSLAAMIVR